MEAYFFERNGAVMVNIKTDASTSVDLVATDAHKARFGKAWNDFNDQGDQLPAFTKDQITSAAKAAHSANKAYCKSIGDDSQKAWGQSPKWQKESAIAGVNFHIENPDADDAASHNSWLAQKDADGWVYGEEKDEDAKTHPCIVPFDELPEEQQKKDAIFRETVWASLNSEE